MAGTLQAEAGGDGDVAGVPNIALPIPNEPTLLGAELQVQLALVSFVNPDGILSATNGLSIRISDATQP